MSAVSRWLHNAPVWSPDCRDLLPANRAKSAPAPTLGELMENSGRFPVAFPLDTVRTKSLLDAVPPATLARNARSAYPVLHESVLHLCARFLLHKRRFGTAVERALYTHMDVLGFIDRLLTKRAVMFVTRRDQCLLLDGTSQVDGWERVGTDAELAPLVLASCLSYDETKISALLSVSSYSWFLNDGARANSGRPSEHRGGLQPEGVIVGVVGTRLERPGAMECQEVLVTRAQNTVLRGYGGCGPPSLRSLFAEFYDEQALLYDNVRYGPVADVHRFTELPNGDIFDNVVYAKRLAVSFDTLLLEANHRALEHGGSAYVHVVGIGLGAWLLAVHQEDVFVDTFGQRLRALGASVHRISDVHFAYFARTLTCAGCKDGDTLLMPGHPLGGIKIHISEREPHAKLPEPDKLLVVSYAWHGNSLPGNEFWKGFLGTSGEAAAAASSQIAELHNPHINRTVCANNLRIATGHGLLPVHDYIDNVHKT